MYNSYLISLQKEKVRRKQSIEQMENMFGINGFEMINAFDARDFYKVAGSNGDFKWWLDEDSFEAIRVAKTFGMPLNRIIPPDFTKTDKWLHQNPGSPGCMLSHGYTWKKFLDTGGDVAFIAEDDIHFVDDVGR
jgi:GR25 family glycosyltransferase involved in LPS biosynthesis